MDLLRLLATHVMAIGGCIGIAIFALAVHQRWRTRSPHWMAHPRDGSSIP